MSKGRNWVPGGRREKPGQYVVSAAVCNDKRFNSKGSHNNSIILWVSHNMTCHKYGRVGGGGIDKFAVTVEFSALLSNG